MAYNRTGKDKNLSRNKIYRLIYSSGGISKPEIAFRLGISLPTAIQNVRYLRQEGFIEEKGVLHATGGRNAVTLACVKDARFAVGVDITQRHMSLVLTDLGGEIHDRLRLPIPYSNSAKYVRQLGELVHTLIDRPGVSADKILGVGISVPGILSSDGRVVLDSHALPISGRRCEDFGKYIDFPCVLCNDANAAGIAEIWERRPVNNVIYLSLSNTVGGSVILDGGVYSGENQRGGEFGHMTLVRDGLPCYCGKKGCLDAYCSATVLSGQTGGDLSVFFDQLKKGDKSLSKLWSRYLDDLAVAVDNLRMAFDCTVIVGGYVGAHIDGYIDALRERVADRNTFEKDGSYLEVCHYRVEAAAVGAALLHIRPFIDSI